MDRRQFLWTGSAAALTLSFVPGRLLAQATSPSSDAALNAIFQRIFDEQVRTSPLNATFLGLDKGKLAGLRSKLDTRPDQVARREEIARTNKFIGWLEKVPETGLSPAGKLNREVILWDLRTGNVGPERFDVSNPQSPYVISQQDGAYFFIPDVLNSAHPIDNAADGNAYLARLEQFATREVSLHPAGRSTLHSSKCASFARPRPTKAPWRNRSRAGLRRRRSRATGARARQRSSPTKSIPRSTGKLPR